MTSAAYGVAGRVDCERAPRGLPGKAFFETSVMPDGLLDEESHAPHAPLERALFNFGVHEFTRDTVLLSQVGIDLRMSVVAGWWVVDSGLVKKADAVVKP